MLRFEADANLTYASSSIVIEHLNVLDGQPIRNRRRLGEALDHHRISILACDPRRLRRGEDLQLGLELLVDIVGESAREAHTRRVRA